ncbi:hypothetical protein IEO21_04884 [Rhodonia placenta]|uniref:Uncharacterized protein n=1 Tax=Rhodonia placenta TaxID=104341 RepID=A0A8H7U247_9APHY|nr:hypothetical protein IEO21_04884 [Postia placenta]
MAISNDMPVSYKTSTDSSPSSLPVHEATGLRCTTESLSGPACYQIGSTMRTEPLVSVQYLKAHLCLLGAFKSLRNSVENAGDDQLPILALGLDKSQRWSWFVGLAVDRFHRWVESVEYGPLKSWVDTELPPLDVLMIWHTYMLNPRWYAEDCERLSLLNNLRRLGDRLIPAVIEIGDPSTYEPGADRVSVWLAKTGTPWDALEAARHMSRRQVSCPRCSASVNTPYLTSEGTGYAQHNFCVKCSECGLFITKESLGLAKFAGDLVSDHEVPDSGYGAYLAGTLHTESEMTDEDHARRIKDAITRTRGFESGAKQVEREQWKREILERFKYSTRDVPSVACLQMQDVGWMRTVKRIMTAYTDDRPFSVELVGAVIRQCSFIDKMHNFGWTAPSFLDNQQDEIVLVNAVTRYHAFLDLMATSPALLLVPTLDIDLAWHSHQLTASKYSQDCRDTVGRYVNQ